jgi:hypothetical protein
MPETNRFLSDTRYLVGAIAVPPWAAALPLERKDKSTRETAPSRNGSSRAPHASNRIAHRLRLSAAARRRLPCRLPGRRQRVAPVLAECLGGFPADHTRASPPTSLRAVIGAFHDKRLEEYRIGFGPRDGDAIYHGVVWPLLGIEDETTDVIGEIEAVLRKCGIKDIVVLDQQFPYEFCDDCGAPLYPNNEGEVRCMPNCRNSQRRAVADAALIDGFPDQPA